MFRQEFPFLKTLLLRL